MARRKSIVNRRWQFETLENRRLMAADLVAVSSLPVYPSEEDTGFYLAVTIQDPAADQLLALENELIDRMQQEAPENLHGFIVALQENNGPTGPYNSEQLLNELYQKHVNAPAGSLNPPPVLVLFEPNPSDFQWDMAVSDAFTSEVNVSIERVGIEKPERQDAFIMALQTASTGPDFIDTHAELDELVNLHLKQNTNDQVSLETQTAWTPTPNNQPTGSQNRNNSISDDPISELLLRTARNDDWIAGVTSHKVYYREVDSISWQVVDLPDILPIPEVYPDGDRLIVAYQLPTDKAYIRQTKQMIVNMRTGEAEPVVDFDTVSNPVREGSNDKWLVGSTSLGVVAYLLGENEAQSLDFLPADLFVVRSEFGDSPDIALLQGLSIDKPLEYRTVTVDLLNRRIVSDEVTDKVGAGFMAQRAGETFNILWQMGDWFNGHPVTGRTPDVPFGYFELPKLVYEIPGNSWRNFPFEKVSLDWSVESISILQFPKAGDASSFLDFRVDVLVQVPGGEPLHQLIGVTISDYDVAMAALKDIAQFLESTGQSLTDVNSGEQPEAPQPEDSPLAPSKLDEEEKPSSIQSVDMNAIPGAFGQLGYIETILRELDLRLKKAQVQLRMTKV